VSWDWYLIAKMLQVQGFGSGFEGLVKVLGALRQRNLG
jgi:hypothetical protein